MSIAIPEELARLLEREDTAKVLVTTDKNGHPYTAVKNSLQVDGTDRLIYWELLESSATNANMVYSIWFDQPIALAIVGVKGESYRIKGRPVKAIVSGGVFRQHYEKARQQLGDVDLAAVWVIELLEIVDQRFTARQQQEEADRPYFKHLDRLAR